MSPRESGQATAHENTSHATPIRVVVADDHPVVREGLRLILESTSDMLLLGDAANGAQLLVLAHETQPDVVLLDLRMPEMGGLEALTRLRQEAPEIAVVILTTYNEDDLMLRGLRAGARGYLLKDASRETLLATIRVAARGETLLQPELLARALAYSAQATSGAGSDGGALTEREREVLLGVARGERSKEIARRLGMAERTVKAHMTSVFNKLGVDSRAAAVAVAMQRGLLPALEEKDT